MSIDSEKKARVTIAVPSFNQGRYLDRALTSLFEQAEPIEVFVMDGGSIDNSLEVIRQWETKLTGWRSHNDKGQSAAINEGIAKGSAAYVCWLNSDDWLLPNSLSKLIDSLDEFPEAPAAYGKAWNFIERNQCMRPIWVEPFNSRRLAQRCIISQPATLIRRSCWEAVGGLDEELQMTMDYDLWWRLFKTFGPLAYREEYIAVNREHESTKTKTNRRLHYQEAIKTVRKHHRHVPLKWWLAQPYKVWFQSIF